MKRLYGTIVILIAALVLFGYGTPQTAAAEELAIPITPTCEIYVNPLYAGQVMPQLQAVPAADEDPDIYYTQLDEVAKALREQMVQREEVITIGYQTDSDEDGLMRNILEKALAHTGDPKQGDYLRWQYGGCNMRETGYRRGGAYYLTLTYYVSYYTTAEQEQLLDTEIAVLLDRLDVESLRDYEKVKAIYDYLCQNVTYDYAGLEADNSKLIYTAYAALINGTSVCQGYATLLYRLALELGVDARLIAGIGNGGAHAWNIVRLGGKYYNLDATWDAIYAQAGWEYQYFLRCQDTFEDHIPSAEYATEEFLGAYPMADGDYKPDRVPIPGDVDGDEVVTDGDALYLLRHTLFAARYPVYGSADVDGDGRVNDADALYLLRYTLFPDRYPLYPGSILADIYRKD